MTAGTVSACLYNLPNLTQKIYGLKSTYYIKVVEHKIYYYINTYSNYRILYLFYIKHIDFRIWYIL